MANKPKLTNKYFKRWAESPNGKQSGVSYKKYVERMEKKNSVPQVIKDVKAYAKTPLIHGGRITHSDPKGISLDRVRKYVTHCLDNHIRMIITPLVVGVLAERGFRDYIVAATLNLNRKTIYSSPLLNASFNLGKSKRINEIMKCVDIHMKSSPVAALSQATEHSNEDNWTNKSAKKSSFDFKAFTIEDAGDDCE